jgi:translation initiation factor IF-2
MLAMASNAIIICYRIKPDPKMQLISKQEKVDIRFYEVIYNVISDIKDAMKGLLKPVFKESLLGRAEIRSLFTVPKAGVVAGSFVTDGKMIRGSHIRLIRDNIVIYEGKMTSLKRFKDDAQEVSSGYECGIGIQNFNNLKPNDIIESYSFEEIPP